MGKPINDISKLSNEEIQKNREVVLNYLNEVEASEKKEAKSKEPQKKDFSLAAPNLIDGLFGGKDAPAASAEKIAAVPKPAAEVPLEKKEVQRMEDIASAKKTIPAAPAPKLPKAAPVQPVIIGIKPAKTSFFRKFFGLKGDQPPSPDKTTEKKPATPAEKKASFPTPKPPEKIKAPVMPPVEIKIEKPKKISFFEYIEEKKASKKPKEMKPEAGARKTHKKRLFWPLLSIFFIVAAAYILFCFTVYIFTLDNPTIKKISRIVPVPAMLTTVGNVGYYDYLDAKREFMDKMGLDEPLDSEELGLLREKMIKEKITSRLADFYGFTSSISPRLPDSELTDKLSIAVVTDPQINQLSITKMKKLVQDLKSGGDFDQVAANFGLPVSIEYFSTADLEKRFNQKIAGIGGPADVRHLAKADGFFVMQFYRKTGDLTGVKYVFIKAKNLDTFVSDELKKVKAIILAR